MDKHQYESYQLRDFLTDPYFESWVNRPDASAEAFWQGWLKDHPDKQQIVNQARSILKAIVAKEKNLQDRPKKLLNQIQQAIVAGRPHQSQTLPIRTNYARLSVAAAASMLLLALVYLLVPRQTGEMVVVETTYGQTRHIWLPDSSLVILNANSTLQFAKDWAESHSREVRLSGEAFFKVKKKSGRANAKFLVRAESLVVEVLGTQFNVNTRRTQASVVLNSGKVQIELASHQQIGLSPGEMLTYDESNLRYYKQKVDTRLYTAWKDNMLIFNETPLSEIARVLEDNYGFRVILEDKKMGKERFYGTFPAQNIQVLINTLSVDFAIEKDGKKLSLNLKIGIAL